MHRRTYDHTISSVKDNMKDFLRTNIPVLLVVAVSMYVNLAVLTNKFELMSEKNEERHAVLLQIKASVDTNTLTLNDLRNADTGLSHRLDRVEEYVPHKIIGVETDLIRVTKDYELLAYKVDQMSINK